MFFFFFLVNELELSIGPPPQKKKQHTNKN